MGGLVGRALICGCCVGCEKMQGWSLGEDVNLEGPAQRKLVMASLAFSFRWRQVATRSHWRRFLYLGWVDTSLKWRRLELCLCPFVAVRISRWTFPRPRSDLVSP